MLQWSENSFFTFEPLTSNLGKSSSLSAINLTNALLVTLIWVCALNDLHWSRSQSAAALIYKAGKRCIVFVFKRLLNPSLKFEEFGEFLYHMISDKQHWPLAIQRTCFPIKATRLHSVKSSLSMHVVRPLCSLSSGPKPTSSTVGLSTAQVWRRVKEIDNMAAQRLRTAS